MSAGVGCRCTTPKARVGVSPETGRPLFARTAWVVVNRNCNYSAFNGYRYAWSSYSALRCLACGSFWRTRAEYVEVLRDATHAETVAAL